MPPLRILVVEDSLLAQQILVDIIESDSELKVVGTALNGQEGVRKTRELKPDLVTMDLMMPVMSGQEAIDQIMSTNACPILVISSNNDSQVAFDACSRGALDVFSKDNLNPEKAETLTRKIKLLAKIKVIGHIRPRTEPPASLQTNHREKKVVAIACSTGGPKALSQLFAMLPENYPHPIVVAQHIENGFSGGLVDWLNQVSPLNVELARANDRLTPGTVHIAPPEKNMKVSPGGVLEFVDRDPADRYAPNCDVLLTSVAQAYGPKCIGVILTGMATDGVAGIKNIRDQGGLTIAQDEASSVVFGMNRKAIEIGVIDRVLPIDRIGKLLIEL